MGKRKAKKETEDSSSSNSRAGSHKKPRMLDNQYYKNKRHNKCKKQSTDKRRQKDESQGEATQSFNGRLSQRFSKQRYKKWRNMQKDDNSVESQESSPSTSAEEIPGFYYDAEKKKYFKILSNINSHNVSVVTREKIEADKAEKKRQKDLSKLSSSTPTKVKSLSSPSYNLALILLSSERGEMHPTQMENCMLTSNIASLEPSGSWTVVGTPGGVQESLEHMMTMDTTEDRDKLLGLWSVKDSMKQRIQLLYLSEKKRTSAQTTPLSLSISGSDTSVVNSFYKISNVCWAPFSNAPDRNNVLYTTMCHTGYSYSLAFIRNLDRTRSEEESFNYNLGSLATWTCAWNLPKQRFSVGSEKRGMLVDVETRRCWEFDCATDPFAQVFSPDSGNYLYSGGRNGMVLCHDLRDLSLCPFKYVCHKTSVCSVKVTSCGNHLLSADISGKVIMWDVRTLQAVMEYPGLFNRYSRIPIQLDETEQLLYGAGQDCYTRFWCLKTGQLLKSLPPPCLAKQETIPSVQYSTRWANCNGNAGLIMGLGDELHYYAGHV